MPHASPRPVRHRPLPALAVAVAVALLGACTSAPDKAAAPKPPATAQPGGTDPNNSADRMIFWISHKEFVPLTDAQLHMWKDRGVAGFVSVVQWFRGMGGSQDFTGDANASLQDDQYAYQRQLRDSRIIERMKALGMKAYLGVYLANQTGGTTPLRDWFDDSAWANQVLPELRDLAAAAKLLGFAGLAVDQELYPQTGNVQKASWSAGYAGNTHTESETRSKVYQRGRQMMSTILDVFPDVEIVDYNAQFPESWEELVQDQANGIKDAMAGSVSIDLWNGMTSMPGYKTIRFVDAIFYKSTQIRGASWDNALQYNANRMYSLLSRRFDNWAYASSRVDVAPFSWIDEGTTRFEAARSPDAVSEQLMAFRKWTAGREFTNFAYTFNTFDYGPYTKAMQAAATPGVVDSQPPGLTVQEPRNTGEKVNLAGVATDNLAIRAVRWEVEDGASGAAKMTWKVKDGSYSTSYDWEMTWTADGVPLKKGQNRITVTAEDIKGLTTTRTMSVIV